MLRHRLTGEDREVDVVVRAQVGEHPVTVSIECIDRARAADVGWIEEMKTKHEHLETDRLVLVSRSGFSGQALSLASSLGIATMTPEQGCELEWTRVVGLAELYCTRYDFEPRRVELLIDPEDGNGPQRFEAGPDTLIQLTDSANSLNLREVVVEHLLRAPDFADRAMFAVPRDATGEVEYDANPISALCAVDTMGRKHRVQSIRVRARCVTKTGAVPLTSVTWNGLPAAFGRAQTPLGDTLITFLEPQHGPVSGKVLVDGVELDFHAPPREHGSD